MARQVPTCRTRPGNADAWPATAFETLDLQIQVVTPMFGGEAEQQTESFAESLSRFNSHSPKPLSSRMTSETSVSPNDANRQGAAARVFAADKVELRAEIDRLF